MAKFRGCYKVSCEFPDGLRWTSSTLPTLNRSALELADDLEQAARFIRATLANPDAELARESAQ